VSAWPIKASMRGHGGAARWRLKPPALKTREKRRKGAAMTMTQSVDSGSTSCRVGSRVFSPNHGEAVRILDVETTWNRTVCHAWVPGKGGRYASQWALVVKRDWRRGPLRRSRRRDVWERNGAQVVFGSGNERAGARVARPATKRPCTRLASSPFRRSRGVQPRTEITCARGSRLIGGDRRR
jgi:hypothetical protein